MFIAKDIKAQENKSISEKSITIISTPNYKAILNMPYSYVVEVTTNDFPEDENPSVSYRLLEFPDGMGINPGTGKIEWIPMAKDQSNTVTVEAFDEMNGISDTQSFQINITGTLNCNHLNLKNLFKLDNLTTDFSTDSKENNNISHFKGNPTEGKGIIDGAFVFDGDDGLWIQGPDDYNGLTDISYTFSVWIKDSSASTLNEVVVGRDSRNDGDLFTHFWLGVNTQGNAASYIHDNTGTNLAGLSGGPNLLDGKWHHLAVVRNDELEKLYLYVDGDVVDEKQHIFQGEFMDEPTEGPLTIGFLDADKTYNFDGMIDELAFFYHALEKSEIKDYYNSVMNSGIGFCASDNSAPTFTSYPDTTVNENELFEYNISISDADLEDTLFLSGSYPAWMQLNRSTNTEAVLSGTDAQPQIVSVSLTVSDGISDEVQEFSFSYGEVSNQPPEITSKAPGQVYEDLEYSYTVAFNVANQNDTVIMSITDLPGWLSFDTLNHKIHGVPQNDHVGQHNFEIIVTDKFGQSDTENVSIKVINTNDPPEILSTAPDQAFEDTEYEYNVSANEPDANDTLVLRATNLPGWLSLDSLQLKIFGTPEQEDVGEFVFTISVHDKHKALDVENITLTVFETNDAPIITSINDTANIKNDSTLAITLSMLNVQDEDNAYPSEFSLTVLEGDNYTVSDNHIQPIMDFTGLLLVKAQVNDGELNSNIFDIPVNVTAITPVSISFHNAGKLHVYPNPAQDILYVDLNSAPGNTRIQVFTIHGKMIMQKQLYLNVNRMDISNLPEGIYFYKIVDSKTKVVEKGEMVIHREQ